jgi:TonB family protein
VWAGIRLFSTKPPSEATTDTVSATRPELPTAEQEPGASTSMAQSSQSQSGQAMPSAGRSASNPKAPVNAKANAKAPTHAMASAGNNAPAKSRPATATSGSSSVAVQEVLPDVPQRSRRTIRGHVRVSVRLIVEQDGTVFAALAEQRGPSRYFERLAIDAAKKWTFTPADSDAQRLMLVKFDFTRNGTTAEAVPLK